MVQKNQKNLQQFYQIEFKLTIGIHLGVELLSRTEVEVGRLMFKEGSGVLRLASNTNMGSAGL